MTAHARRRLGTAGEGHARRYLEAKGYVFVASGWRTPTGELDLVMWDGSELVFIEVKTRRGEAAGRAEDAVSRAQAGRLLATAEAFIAAHPDIASLDPLWRVDLVAITLDRTGAVASLRHFLNAIVSD